MNWSDRVSSDSAICMGRVCVTGTRIMVSTVLDNLAEGLAPEEIVKSYPPLTLDDLQACISYAAAAGVSTSWRRQNATWRPED